MNECEQDSVLTAGPQTPLKLSITILLTEIKIYFLADTHTNHIKHLTKS